MSVPSTKEHRDLEKKKKKQGGFSEVGKATIGMV